MELKDAINLVWDDVADSVYRHPTVHDAVRYARQEMTADELATVKDDQKNGHYDHPDSDVRGDVHGAYVLVRAADEHDVTRVLSSIVYDD